MSRKLIIFGNGLGRALDNDYFDLKNAMDYVWKSKWLSPKEKALIATLDGFDAHTGPSNEDNLISAYGAQLSINLLRKCLEKGSLDGWMTKEGSSFSKVLEKYVYAVAYYFANFAPNPAQEKKLSDFSQPLIDHIASHHSHVATLNYDTLLYDPFLEQETSKTGKPLCVDKISDTKLFDGFGGGGKYIPDRFTWYKPNTRGTYMHLHGTPLFIYEKTRKATKRKRSSLPLPSTFEGKTQVILGPSDLKKPLIETHDVLNDYWENRLPNCIDEAEEIILFGYGGADTHLNELMETKGHSKKKYVVQWSGEKKLNEKAWKEKLGSNVEIIPKGDILEFKEWADPSSSLPW